MFFPAYGDSYYPNVVAMLPMDGAHNSTSFLDLSPTKKTVTTSGSPIISTALAFPAAYIPTGSFITVASHADFDIGTGDYTVSLKCRLTDLSSSSTLFDCRPSADGPYICLYVNNAGKLYFHFTTNPRIQSNSGVITANTNYMIALCRSGSSTKMFVNGTQVGSTYSDSSSIPASHIEIGRDALFGDKFIENGYIWDVQYVKEALYTDNFTPPDTKSLRPFYKKIFLAQPYLHPGFPQQIERLGL